MVAAGCKHESGVVLHVLPADLLSAINCQHYRVAQLSDREFFPLQNFTMMSIVALSFSFSVTKGIC